MKIWYKIVEKKNGKFYTLYHGNNGSRELKVGEWIGSVRKKVHDGTRGTPYWSGWHVIGTRSEARRYMKKFSKPRELHIIPCRARTTIHKRHCKYDVHLAKQLYIHEETLRDSQPEETLA